MAPMLGKTEVFFGIALRSASVISLRRLCNTDEITLTAYSFKRTTVGDKKM